MRSACSSLQDCRLALLQCGGLSKLLAALNQALKPIRRAAAAKEESSGAAPVSEAAAEASQSMAPEDLIVLLESLEQLAKAQSSHPGLARDPQANHQPCLLWRIRINCKPMSDL